MSEGESSKEQSESTRDRATTLSREYTRLYPSLTDKVREFAPLPDRIAEHIKELPEPYLALAIEAVRTETKTDQDRRPVYFARNIGYLTESYKPITSKDGSHFAVTLNDYSIQKDAPLSLVDTQERVLAQAILEEGYSVTNIGRSFVIRAQK